MYGANHIGDKRVLYSHLTSDHETLTMGNEDRKKQNYIVLRL